MKLFYREYGKGQPIIILHGILGISDNWAGIARNIAEDGYRVLIPDQRNHGQSPHNPVFNYHVLTEDLSEFIETKNLKNSILLGHSMGGKVAMRYSLENPGSVSRIIIVDINPGANAGSDFLSKLINVILSVDFSRHGNRREVRNVLSEKIKDERLVQFVLKNLYWKEKGLLSWRPDLHAISSQIESIYEGIDYPARFNKPALFIRGGKSGYLSGEHYADIYRNFPQAVIETIENGTHWIHADEPAAFCRLVREFLKS